MEELKIFDHFIPHLNKVNSHTYLKDGEDIHIKTDGAGGVNTYKVLKNQSIEVTLAINPENKVELDTGIKTEEGEFIHLSKEAEIKYLAKTADFQVKWPSKEDRADLDDHLKLIEKETSELKDLFEKNDLLVNPGTNVFALEIIKEGVSIRIYIDDTDKGIEYQAVLSLSPFSGEKRPCKKRETLLRQIDELVSLVKNGHTHDSEILGC